MALIQYKCAKCGKKTHVVKEWRDDVFKVVFKTLECGHTLTEEIVALPPLDEGHKLVCAKCLVEVDPENYSDFAAHENCEWESRGALTEIPSNRMNVYSRLRPFQQDGVDFLEKANFNSILADEQGLGKTVQVLSAIAHSKDKLTPTLYVVKAALRMNWLEEMVNRGWLCEKDNPLDYPFVLLDGRSAILPGFKHYVIPYTLLAKFQDQLIGMGFKCLVIDESQNFANMATARTKSLLAIAKHIPHHMCISGTPILNRASEYFPVLHMVKPDHWYSYKHFVNGWLDVQQSGNGHAKIRGISAWRRDEFFRRTSPYMLRRRKRDVLKDLPKFKREFLVVDVSDSGVSTAYNSEAAGLDDYMHSTDYQHDNAFARSRKQLAYLMRMRHLCGMAKAIQCIDEAREFLESTEVSNEKLIIGVHHDDVTDALKLGLAEYNPVMLGSGLDGLDRAHRVNEFKTPSRRLCIAKILAQGEGLNLQFCSNMIVLERMWNPGKEEQFEARIDRYGQLNPTRARYLVAKGTVDEDFSEIVEDKRQYCGGSIDKDFDFEMDGSLLNMLSERAARRRMAA